MHSKPDETWRSEFQTAAKDLVQPPPEEIALATNRSNANWTQAARGWQE